MASKVDTFDKTSVTDEKVGPGTYEVVDCKLSKTNDKVIGGVIGTEQKLKMDKLISPAPNHYLVNELCVRPDKISYSIGRASLEDRG